MYVKLFAQILDSSIWLESGDTRLVWITLLAAMDRDGFARFAAVENLARRANVTLKACEKAVQTLEAPNSNSSDPTNEGKRIERVPGGWLILNAGKYRDLEKEINRREKTRERVANWRQAQREKASNAVTLPGNADVTKSNAMQRQRHEEVVEVENHDMALRGVRGEPREPARPKPRAIRASAKTVDGDFVAGLKSKSAYEGIDIDRELSKAQSWAEVNRRNCTPRFLVNWLNRVERPIAATEGETEWADYPTK